MKIIRSIMLLASLAAGISVSAHAAFPQYTLTDLGSLDGNFSLAYDINDLGDVVGVTRDASGTQHSFLYSGGTLHDLGAGWARGINNRRQILDKKLAVGQWNAETQVVTWTDFSETVGNLDLAPGHGASKINDRGEIVGFRKGQLATEAFYLAGSTLSILGVVNPDACDDRHYVGINNRSEVAFGSTSAKAFVVSHGVATQVYPPLIGAITIKAINDVGEYVGTRNEAYAWYYSPIKGYRRVPFINTIDSGSASVEDINNQGLAVGVVGPSSVFPQGVVERGESPDYGRAFIFSTVTDAAADLNTLIPAGSGWVLNGATAINDAGQIVGYGITPAGAMHAFLLTPSN